MKNLIFTVLLCIGAGCSSTKTTTKIATTLDGTWVVVKQEMNGVSLPETGSAKDILVMADSNYTYTTYDKGICLYKNGKMDIYGKQGPNSGKHYTAIYKLENGQLTICYNLSGNSYPELFDTKEKPTFFLSVFKKEMIK